MGDDIRQDILTLQMIRIMDKLWKSASMDLRLQPYHLSFILSFKSLFLIFDFNSICCIISYFVILCFDQNRYGCVSMGESIGMIEVVLNSKTIASINKDAGGTGAVLEDKTLAIWLRKHNHTDALYNAAVKTFILSCAGYPHRILHPLLRSLLPFPFLLYNFFDINSDM